MSRRITAALAAAAVTLILASGGASGRSNARGQQPPKNQTPPSINGNAVVPNTLTASTGTWQGKGLKFAYQWLRCDSAGASCSAISGATGSAKTLSTADAGSTLRVIVTASNRNGSAAATSAQTASVAPAASPPPPSSAPSGASLVPPSDQSPPTVSGTAQQGQTLTTSTGSWSGTTPMTYTYQWQRCNATGGACTPISGATVASYLLTAADVGSTLRTSVTASNSVGSATASSAATSVVASLPTAGDLSPSGYYYDEHFDGTFNEPNWILSPSSPLSNYWLSWNSSGYSGRNVRVTVPAMKSPGVASDGTVWASASAYAELIDIWRYSDKLGAPSLAAAQSNTGNGVHAEAWLRFKVRFPAGLYKPSPGTQNTIFGMHIDATSVDDANAHGTGAYSDSIGIATDGFPAGCSTTAPYHCTQVGTNPRMFLQIIGDSVPGNYSRQSNGVTRFYMPSNSLQFDHWYDIVLHSVFDANSGVVQWWVDGTKVYDSGPRPTVYVRSNGTWSFNTNSIIGDYRYWTSYSSAVDFDEAIAGPTAASVGFAP
jgi:hypothetical protein